MWSLKSHLNKLDFAKNLAEVEKLFCKDDAKAKVTFWGGRVVKVDGFKGFVSLDFLARKLIKAANARCESDDLTVEERLMGLNITRKVNLFYINIDEQKDLSNFFTKFLVWIRSFSFSPYTPRLYINDFVDDDFLAYSKEKFMQQFGGYVDDLGEHPAARGAFEHPVRIIAREENVQQLHAGPIPNR